MRARAALVHGAAIVTLTALTQLGGIAWALALAARRRVLVFLLAYAALSAAAAFAAPLFGRVPLPCFGEQPLRMHSPLYCVLNRHYAAPKMVAVLHDLAATMDRRFPGTPTLVLDASFPFLDRFPMLPHLSHDDGEKADIAFPYVDASGRFLPGRTPSPLGYFAFRDGPTDCPQRWLTLRWDLAWLQPLWPDWPLDPARLQAAVAHLTADPRVAKIFLEPHLASRLEAAHPKIRFQGCRAARHDDHLHLQL